MNDCGQTIETFNVLKVQPLDKFGTPIEIVRLFGGKDQYERALRELESALYAAAGSSEGGLQWSLFSGQKNNHSSPLRTEN